MPRAYGSDRLVEGPAGRFYIICEGAKGWTPRRDRTTTAAEHPGTAVDWDGDWFEVSAAETLGGGSVRYTLVPWRSSEAMRLVDRYDEESERGRGALRRTIRVTESRRRVAILLGPVLGHLPCAVQEALHERVGAPPVLLSVISLAPPAIFGVACVNWWLRRRMGGPPAPVPELLVSAGLALLAESIVRMRMLLTTGRACGSLAGVIGYSIYYLLRRDRAGLPDPMGLSSWSAPASIAPPGVAQKDRFRMTEPFLALLSPDEQRQLAARYGFDPRRWGRRTAVLILILCACGVISDLAGVAIGRRDVVTVASLFTGAALGIEQVLRLGALSRGPAGSVLGALVRPFTRPLL